MKGDGKKQLFMDDESFLTLTGAGMPGVFVFYTKNIESCPEDVKFRYDEKFPEKVMVHTSISKKGFFFSNENSLLKV